MNFACREVVNKKKLTFGISCNLKTCCELQKKKKECSIRGGVGYMRGRKGLRSKP